MTKESLVEHKKIDYASVAIEYTKKAIEFLLLSLKVRVKHFKHKIRN